MEANAAAEPNIAVQLGAICIERKYPVVDVSRALGVSRQTVYDWFSGKSKPTKDKAELIEQFIHSLTVTA